MTNGPVVLAENAAECSSSSIAATLWAELVASDSLSISEIYRWFRLSDQLAGDWSQVMLSGAHNDAPTAAMTSASAGGGGRVPQRIGVGMSWSRPKFAWRTASRSYEAMTTTVARACWICWIFAMAATAVEMSGHAQSWLTMSNTYWSQAAVAMGSMVAPPHSVVVVLLYLSQNVAAIACRCEAAASS